MKYSVFVQKIVPTHRSGKYNSNHASLFKGTFNNKEKALEKAKSYSNNSSVNYIVVKELDEKDKYEYTSGRQMRSGVYYAGRTHHTDYTKKEIIYEVGYIYGNSPIRDD